MYEDLTTAVLLLVGLICLASLMQRQVLVIGLRVVASILNKKAR